MPGNPQHRHDEMHRGIVPDDQLPPGFKTPGRDGDDGEPGPPGPPGQPGAAGSPGADGATGAAGRPGADGSDGDDGVSIPGPQGNQGIPGPTGQLGPPGPPGEDGDDGVGYPGAPGATGAAGAAGADGRMGAPGVDGDDGADGVSIPGPQGIAGPPGPQGNFGPPGVPGEDGDDGIGYPGPAGATGATGSQGIPGVAGDDGRPGSDGNDGDDGWPLPGPQGVVGPQGQPGNMGPPGYDGSDGDDGVGIPGAPGPQGTAGTPGAAGAIGPMGPPGDGQDGDDGWTLPGPQGLQGIQGIQGVPGSGGGSGTTIIQNTEDDDGGFPRSGEPSPLIRELMQSNSTPANNEIVRIGWSAVVEGLPLTINVGQIIEIATDGLLTLTVPGAPLHDHSSAAQGSTLRPRILNVGVPAANGSQDVTLWRETDGSLTIDKDGANTPLPGLNLRTLLVNANNNLGGVLWSTGGTSFPTSGLATDYLFYRTDLDMWFFYDGTRWLSSTLYRETFLLNDALQPIVGAAANVGYSPAWNTDHDLWVEKLYASTYVATTNNGTNFWTVALNKINSAFALTSMGNFTTAADTVATLTKHTATIGALLTPGTNPLLGLSATKTLTPGGITMGAAFTYRLVGV